MMDKQIYAVYATDTDRNHLLGYVTCDDIKDIHTFFDKKKAYGIEITPIKVLHINPELAADIRRLEKQKEEASNRLDAINKDLAKYGIK